MAYRGPEKAGEMPRRGKEMPLVEKQAAVAALITNAVQYVDGELSPERAKATAYYQGKPFGNEEPGRSQVVLRTVSDTVRAIIPSVMRVFFGTDRPVEFVPDRPDTVPQAEQATDFVNHVFVEENAGFLQSLAVLKDGLIKKIGILKWWWDDTSTTKAYRMERLTEEQYQALLADPDIEFTKIEMYQETDETGAAVTYYDCDLTHRERDGRVRIMAVPPEEFIFSRDARSVDDAQFVGHRQELTRGDLIAMGYDPEEIDAHGGRDSGLDTNVEQIERQPGEAVTEEPPAGKANDRILYVEGYAYLDVDGDGVAELRKICTIGPGYHIVHDYPCDERPFSVWCPDPEPHTLVGQSVADLVMDLQKTTSFVARATMDGLAASIFPRLAIQEGEVNVADAQNTEIGALIRTKRRPADVMQEFKATFDAGAALGVLEFLDAVRESRTGLNKGSIGLDADALQSSTKAAVGAAVTAAQAQVEMYARLFAEQAMKPMFRGVLRLLVRNQPRARMVRLRGQWANVDPRPWNANMDVSVNVALGTGMTETKIASLLQVLDFQLKIMELFGPNNPVVSLVKIRNTASKITELNGWLDTSQFFNPLSEADFAAMQEAAAQTPPPPSPEMVLAEAQIQIERMKAEKEIEIAEAREMREHRELELRDDRERDKQAADIVLRLKELELKYGVQLAKAEIDAEIKRQRETSQSADEPA